MRMELRDRFRGALLGLATGDAVGTTLEFKSPGGFTPINDMVGGGPFRLAPGEWTDDTSMALCLAESLIECAGFDPVDQLDRYLRWWREGHLSSTGRCFDIGIQTREALTRFEKTREPYPGSTDPERCGNGSIMRLAPMPLAYTSTPREAVELSAASSRTTHGARRTVDACRYLGALIVGAIAGTSKEELLNPRYEPVEGLWRDEPLDSEIDEVAAGSFTRRQPPEIQGSGFVVRSLEAALWAFATTDDFREGCLAAANLGDDADTTAAIYGQLAGAVYGVEAIPEEWLEKIALRDRIESLADGLLELAGRA
jgi:ADP-ribosyl-[dinitrogen reductase] hydrolase